ncbi:MAG: 50S ribosomal protein L23 [Patescibacteria group bacterium]|nr:50S ribosomal protein L23 [Patescibacteria group bacterium]
MSLLDRFKKSEEKKIASDKKEAVLSAKKEKQTKKKILKARTDKPAQKAQKTKGAQRAKKQAERVYDIIREPHITEKASYLAEQNKYIFKVKPKANKTEIKKAVEALYETKVERVNITRAAAKKRRMGKTEGWRGGLKKGFKKAIITLKEGEKIEIISGS